MVKKAFEVVYENGVLRPLSPLPLTEGQQVRISFEKQEEQQLDDTLLKQLVVAAEATPSNLPGPILAYEAAEQLQAFLDKTKEESA